VNVDSYQGYFLLNASLWKQWVETDDGALNSQDNIDLFERDRSAFIRTLSGNPGYCMPSPW
ncbi:MAG: hypothetical protein AAF514_13075, partial [Verrucomicrobiota bacterium]